MRETLDRTGATGGAAAAFEFVAIDLETTGLSVDSDVIIEVGATRFDRDGRCERFSTFVDPGRPIPPEVQALTAIADADVRGAPSIEEVAPLIAEFAGGSAIVGQNIQFDLAFLGAVGVHLPGPSYDTWEIASVLLPRASRLNLGTLAALLDVEMPVAHRALADAEATRDIFLGLLTRLEALPRPVLLEVLTFAERAGWALSTLVTRALERDGGSPGPAAQLVGEEEARAILEGLVAPPARVAVTALRPRERPRPIDAADVRGLFAMAAQGRRFPGYEPREGQRAMAEAIADVVTRGGRLAVEAGTGTGKSLAYLLPSLLNAVWNDDRVVISTQTRNLQEQLASHDAPAAAAIVEAYAGADPGSLRIEVLKGRSNYLCLERWAEARADPRPRTEPEARLFARVATWLPETDTGDLGELYMTSAEEPAWSQLSAEGGDCLSRRCAYVRDGTCFLLRARQRAAGAHAVIVNHALLLSNALADDQVLPPFRHLVIDEAHRLEDAATERYGATLSLRELGELLTAVGGDRRGGGLADRVRQAPLAASAALSPAAMLAGPAAAVSEAVERTRERVQPLAEQLRHFAREFGDGDADRGFTASLTAAKRAQPAWDDVEDQAVQLDVTLLHLRERVRGLLAALESLPPGTSPEIETVTIEVTRALDALAQARETLGRVALRADPEHVAWVMAGRGDVRLSTAPLEVGATLRNELYRDRHSVTLTSATLTTSGSFDFTLERLGLEDAGTLEVPSPYDYRRAVLALVVRDLPEPGMPGYDFAVHETLLDASRGAGGRTLALFTSHGAVRAAAAALRDALSAEQIAVMAQGLDGSPSRLLRLLRERPRSLLLGTAAFWEGVDVPGDALSQIAIARLPFPVPTDPIYAGRSERYEEPFEQFALPQSVLRFRQGFGRLIRGSGDRGVFIVLDSRIHRRQYGEAFLRSLPDCEVREVHSSEVEAAVSGWLAR